MIVARSHHLAEDLWEEWNGCESMEKFGCPRYEKHVILRTGPEGSSGVEEGKLVVGNGCEEIPSQRALLTEDGV